MRPVIFIINVVVVLFSVSISNVAGGKKITLSSRMSKGLCEQRDEYAKSKKLVPPVKKLPPPTSPIPCGWFRIQKCPECDFKFKTCAEVAASAPKTATESGIGIATGTGPVGTGTMGTGPVGTGTMGTGPIGTGTMGTGPVGTGTMGTVPVGTGPVVTTGGSEIKTTVGGDVGTTGGSGIGTTVPSVIETTAAA